MSKRQILSIIIAFVVLALISIASLIVYCNRETTRSFLPKWTFHHREGSVIGALAFSPDSKTLVAGSTNVPEDFQTSYLYIWNLTTNKEVKRIPYKAWINSLVYTPNGDFLIAGTGVIRDKNDPDSTSHYSLDGFCPRGEVCIWESKSWGKKNSFELPGIVIDVAVSQNGKLVAALSSKNGDLRGGIRVSYWNFPEMSNETHFDLDGYAFTYLSLGPMRPLAFSPNGKYIAVCNSKEPKQPSTVIIWGLAEKNILTSLPIGNYPGQFVAFSTDTNKLIVSADQVTVWDTNDWDLIRKEKDVRYISGIFSEEESLYIGNSFNRTKTRFAIFDMNKDTRNAFVWFCTNREGYTRSLAMSPDKNMIACGGAYLDNVYVWKTPGLLKNPLGVSKRCPGGK
jgi:WD40 repeat protein